MNESQSLAGGTVAKRIVEAGPGRKPLGPYSAAVEANGFVFTAGQLGIVENVGLVEGGIVPETRQALENLVGVLDDAGCTVDDVVKVTIFLADIADWPEVNVHYAEVFGQSLPARSAVEVAQLPAGARIEIEAIALSGA